MVHFKSLLLCILVSLSSISAFQNVGITKLSAMATVDRNQRFSTKLSVGGLSEALTAYTDALEANPLIVKSVTASIILGSADLAGQSIEKMKKEQEDGGSDDSNSDLDVARVFRFFIFGLVLQAPWNHFYYLALDGAIPPTPDPLTATTGIKVFIDQFVQAPVFTILIFAFLGTLEGKSLEEIKKQLDDDYVDTMFANWKLFIPATIINLGFVPPLFRVLYLNVVFFFWSIYLSLVINKEAE